MRWNMRARIGHGPALALVVALLGCALPAAAGERPNVANFVLEDLDGKKVSLGDLRANGPVVIDFWATWCKPCTRSMPHLDELGKKYAKDGLAVVAISIDDTRSLAKVKSYVQTHEYQFHVLLDSNQRVLRQLQGTGVPYVVVVSEDGQLLYSHSGYKDGDEEALAKVVAEAMGDASAGATDSAKEAPAAAAETGTPAPETATTPAGEAGAGSESGSSAGGDR